MRTLLRTFGILLLLGGIFGTAYFSYFAFVEGGHFAERDNQRLAEQQRKRKTLEQEKQKPGISSDERAKLEKEYLKALETEEMYVNAAADNVDFYKRQTIYAIGSGVILGVGLLVFILSFIGRRNKGELFDLKS
jgi:hypothetical protein